MKNMGINAGNKTHPLTIEDRLKERDRERKKGMKRATDQILKTTDLYPTCARAQKFLNA